ncbi:hypothetical protein TcCL_Unassigned01371 [Trypanosoma cruzi]|uniref:Uncharacterized protein n=1 Tax=Trypanosoma cruzi (strain CL Brener) TaxID=353153 RepID=Q4CVZ6_TRYCC|nr:uncharacterized protein Tc00.1047053506217.10 [Trypanosoma cruzi]EAN84446.1 hypothetical protein Tc00.1047053506217.10 [Trypanosoma cruzi]RNC35734.1 hypothetical protein TcCL_Unassigned01371 [Trypanosoma cruzi]|eukprot:XP_806297.1 hypothetical protein Tc00.1047053506217.10 [Trypanosoma cruzi strain CL Brener]
MHIAVDFNASFVVRAGGCCFLRGHEEKEETVGVRRGSHPLWEGCAACGGIAFKRRTNTHEDMARSGRLPLCFVSAAVGVGAAASDLSARWPQRVAVTLFSWEYAATLLRVFCFGDNVLAAV